MKLPYQLNHENKTIALTRKFAKESSIPDSKQYELLMKLKSDFSDYTVETRTIETKKKKEAYYGGPYEFNAEHKIVGPKATNNITQLPERKSA